MHNVNKQHEKGEGQMRIEGVDRKKGCKKKRKQGKLSRLLRSQVSSSDHHRVLGVRGRAGPAVTADKVVELIMVLPGSTSAAVRQKAASLFFCVAWRRKDTTKADGPPVKRNGRDAGVAPRSASSSSRRRRPCSAANDRGHFVLRV